VRKLAFLGLIALVALVAPVQAKTPKPAKTHPLTSHKCTPHGVAYRVSGTLVSGSLTKNADGTYSGDLTVHVLKANKHAKADKGTDKGYSLDHAKAKLHGADPAALATGSRVNLKGKVTTLAKKCDQTGFTPVTTIKKADIKPPKAPKPPKPADSAKHAKS
jgi:hypothetical protein